jgi:hypothetical protein
MNQPTSPGAPDEPWSTGVQSASPIVSPSVPTKEVSPGGQHVAFYADADPGGRDIVADSVAGAVSNAEGRYHELASDTYGLGSHIGDLMDLPLVPSDKSKHTGSPGSPDSGPAG